MVGSGWVDRRVLRMGRAYVGRSVALTKCRSLGIHIAQSLVDDNLVHMEKIGISNYYWAFPSEASVMVRVT